MKASSICWELDIELTYEEISKLEKKILKGKIKVRNREKLIRNSLLNIKRGDSGDHHVYMLLNTIPRNVYFGEVEKYTIIISNEGYKILKKREFVKDRMFDNPSCNINIYKKNFIY